MWSILGNYQTLIKLFKLNSNNITTMLNPHQNININISYNLTQNKPNKPIGKKISKIQKPSFAHSTTQYDIEIKMKNKSTQQVKRLSQHKTSNDNKKTHKKKPSNIARNTFTPDLYDRRIKTEGPSADQQTLTLKREKHKPHSKSIHPIPKLIISNKKTGSTKAPNKSLKIAHVNSFMLLNGKKNVIELPQNNVKKRRAQSAFAKNDKVVSKLLNMSLLASQLGGSRPITSERKCIDSHSKTFKEYLSSIDVRILKTMSDDVPIFTTKINSYQETVKAIMRRNQISLEELTRKVVIIQRAWKKSMKTSIVNKYKLIFQQATDKLIKQDKTSYQISSIAAQSARSDIHQFAFVAPKSQSSANIESLQLSQRKENVDEEDYHLKWIEESQQAEIENLNIAKYRQLVTDQINKHKQISNKPKQQHFQWNTMNKKLTNLMNDRKQFDPTTLLDDFIEQSNLNKHWIQNQYEPSPFNSANKQYQPSQPDPSLSNSHFIRQENENEDSLDQSQGYDHTKYINPDEEHQILQRKMQQLQINKKRDQKNSQFQSINNKWINQKANDNVVKGYLDCGLDDFGLNLNRQVISIDDKDQDFQSLSHYQQEQEYHLSSDQAIGAKFQEANRGIIRRNSEQLDTQPKINGKEKSIDGMVQQAIQHLISQFAIDISSILKKSTQTSDKRKAQTQAQQQGRTVPGIATNFNSIKQYLTKFTNFISRQQSNLSKIIDNINKDIGPTSLQILSYLRPEAEYIPLVQPDNESLSFQQQGLFVIPAEMFQLFQVELENQYKIEHQKQMGPRIKAYANFWHRCIFESFNQCLDYQRPYGIEGKPYDWVIETKIFRKVKKSDLKKCLQNGQNRLLQMTLMVGGIIFQKPDSPFANADFSLQERHRINEQRLSRILATELLESEQSWINYNDEMAQLLVQLSRMIEDKVFFEYVTEMKRFQRRRKLLCEDIQQENVYHF